MAQKARKRFEIQYETREELGKGATKILRAEGLIPAVFYSGGGLAVHIKFPLSHYREMVKSGEKIFNITVDGEQRRAMVKAVQYHPLTDKVRHVDLQGVRLRDIIEIPVPIILNGLPIGVKVEGGLLQHIIHEVTISCKGEDVPDFIELDVSGLHLGDTIHGKDLEDDRFTFLIADDASVVTVAHPQKMRSCK
jgi:ribosomal protein L25, Ctc-form